MTELSWQHRQTQKKLSRQIRSLISKPGGNVRLLVNLPCASGKTHVTVKQLLDNPNVITIYLCQSHNICYEHIEKFGIKAKHILGANQLCNHPKKAKCIGAGVIVSDALCMNCKVTCPYKKQIADIIKNPRSIITVQAYLNTDILDDFIEAAEEMELPVILVIDEDVFGSLKETTEITIQDLFDTKNLIDEYCETHHKTKPVRLFSLIIWLLQIELGHREKYSGVKLIKFLYEQLSNRKFHYDAYKSISHKSWGYTLGNLKKLLREHYENEEYIKDIIPKLKEIIDEIYDYYGKIEYFIGYPIEFNTSITSCKNNIGKWIIKHQTIKKSLPKLPTIILDASGTKEFYEEIFDLKFRLFNSKISIPRNIIQVKDGNYGLKSLGFGKQKEPNLSTQHRVFSATHQLVSKHLENEEQVGIISMQKVLDVLIPYLLDKGIKKEQLITAYYGNLRGKNNMEHVKTLIVLGTPEPNLTNFPFDVGCYYKGENKISTKRRKDGKGHCYMDKRYRLHVERIREKEIEQAVNRLRFSLFDKDKICYLFSKLSISFPTKEVMLEDILPSKEPENPYVKILSRLIDGEKRWKVDVYDKLKGLKLFEPKGLLRRTKNELIKFRCVTKHYEWLKITEKGLEYYKSEFQRE